MKAKAVWEHFRRIGTWVNWGKTTDGFHFGSAETDVQGIAVGWKPYWDALRQAAELGCNVFLGHESIFREGADGDETGSATELEEGKLAWLRESGMAVYRCHDVWDVMPGVGVRDSWARGLGFEGEPVAASDFYRVESVEGRTFGSVCEQIASHVKDVGQEAIQAVGDREARVSRLGLGTGAITRAEKMLALGADVCVICDDYFRYVRDGALLRDLNIPFVVVNHGAAEEWGMRGLFAHAREAFEGIPLHFLAQGCTYRIAA